MAVNYSPAQLKSRNVVESITLALSDTGLAANRLQLEIIETAFLRDSASILETLRALRQLGVQIALDDFGTGYSSLSHLRNFPFDKVKIDQSYIQHLASGGESLGIVHAVTGLAKCLKMISSAEGVETQTQLDALRSIGCTEMQGYLFSQALPAKELGRFFEAQSKKPLDSD